MRQKKTKAFSWLLILVMVFSLISPGMVWNVKAEEAYEGYLYVTVEKSTLGQGLIIEPVKAGFYKDDTLVSVIRRVLGEENIGFTNSSYGNYLSKVKDGGVPAGWTTENVPEPIRQAFSTEGTAITDRSGDSSWLKEADYTSTAGWSFGMNDKGLNFGADNYYYKESEIAKKDTSGAIGTYDNGDVVRLQYTIYGYGMDLNTWDSSWGTEALVSFADKDDLIKAMADCTSKTSVDYQNALTVLSDWDATKAEIDSAVRKLGSANSISDSYSQKYKSAIQYLKRQAVQPSYGSEWQVLAIARSGIKDVAWYKAYKDSIEDTLKENKSNILNNSKSTENSRVIIGLTAIGADAANIAGYDLTEPFTDFDFVKKQGINGSVYALIALDCGEYVIPKTTGGMTQTTRDQLVREILGKAVENGGWTLSGSTADPDMTGMVIQALAPYYSSNLEVKAAVDKALVALSNMQKEDGGFASCESCAQMLCALSVLGIDTETDSRFIKNGNSVLDALLSFYDESTGGFKHTLNGAANGMASEQAAYALTAYSRLKNNQNGLYVMSDAECLYQCEKNAHVWKHGVIIQYPTLSTTGKTQYTCTVCGETKTEIIPMLITTEQITGEEVKQEKEATTEQKVSIKNPGKTSLSKVISPKKKQIKVTWKKKSGVTGYQIQVSTSSKFKKSQTKTYKISKQKTTSKTIKSLKSKKKYYVRIRTYKTAKVNGKMIEKYSSWSAKKAVKVK